MFFPLFYSLCCFRIVRIDVVFYITDDLPSVQLEFRRGEKEKDNRTQLTEVKSEGKLQKSTQTTENACQIMTNKDHGDCYWRPATASTDRQNSLRSCHVLRVTPLCHTSPDRTSVPVIVRDVRRHSFFQHIRILRGLTNIRSIRPIRLSSRSGQ